ncbi:helix-turn-helix domain-containing protein [Streptomyces iconiensis]|uniref:XRE family transcriptional regulator n=1 Tax=Streptomyces iconiensis TaxID=1384038 RepID=A0ABT7A4Q7_9ACTN|nr:XRE family transcriptional regulator [Streptomyces iconiensis]MDJ1136320.1 XRE family transcriptional regulator [Streptomyces iconiensis]
MSPHDGPVREMLAANVKRARSRKGLSLSELARLSHISKATLSQLEAGTGNPTIETVFSLSRALELPLSDMLERQHTEELTVVRAAEAEVISGTGVDLRPLHTVEGGGATFEIYDQRVRAGSRQESLGHAGREHTAVQTGRLAVRVDGTEVELAPGDYIAFDAALPHSYTALADTVRSVLFLTYRAGRRQDARVHFADHRDRSFYGTEAPSPGTGNGTRGGAEITAAEAAAPPSRRSSGR